MYSIQNLGLHFTGEYIFRDLNIQILEKDRIGLVGLNGAGKSSLLKIIVGELEENEGGVVIPSNKRIGYLPQEMEIIDDTSVWGESLKAFTDLNYLEDEMEKLNAEINRRTDFESASYLKLIEKLNQANEKFEMLDGSKREANTEKILLGLGFRTAQFYQPTSTLSGGWRMRIELVKILLQQPDLLLLDEPTNHLDIESIRWFENFLSGFQGAFILVSHDRSFLDATTKRTLEINNKKIRDYKFSYTQYKKVRSQEMEQQKAAFDNQQQQIKEIERFIERFRYKSTKAKQVQSRIKMLDRMNVVEIDSDDSSKINFSFPPSPHSGKVTLEIKGYSKSYGNHQVLENVNMIMPKGEFVAFVGRNGEGKTTLAKSIVGKLDFEGEIKYGHKVKIGYYAQNQAEFLDDNKSVFESLDDVAVGDIRKNIRGILGSFLFSDDDIDKKVKILSGGERSRLALAILLLTPVNLLVLDEPTNHLDMQSKDILKNALLNYDGSVIIVSHDRDFLSGLTDKTYEFKNRGIKEHLGDINEFLRARKIEEIKEIEQKQKKKQLKHSDSSKTKNTYEERKFLQKQRRKLQKQIRKCENDISKWEDEIMHLNKHIANPEDKNIDYQEIYSKHKSIQKKIDIATEEWETKSEELLQLENEIRENNK